MTHPLHPKRAGTSVEDRIINREDALAWVSDREQTAWDAKTTGVIDWRDGVPLGGVCVVEAGTPVEIKGCLPERSNGDRSTAGHWYVKRETHETLADAGGVYWLTVYAPQPETPILAELVVPAATVGDVLAGRWYDSGRREGEVAQLTWTTLIGREAVEDG